MVLGWLFSYGWYRRPVQLLEGRVYNLLYDYSRICMPILFVVGGLATQLERDPGGILYHRDGRAVNLLSARIFAKEDNGRLSMDASGSIGNSNDLAAHLIIVLPFLLFISMDKKRNPLLRLAMVPLMGYGVSVILGTASRGGLIALGVVFVFMILRATPKQRILSLVAAVVLGGISLAVLPSATINRLGSLFGGQNEEAEESGESRSYLFWTSVDYTLHHPVFGVGLGQFANFEGKTRVAQGQVGNWHATHYSWTRGFLGVRHSGPAFLCPGHRICARHGTPHLASGARSGVSRILLMRASAIWSPCWVSWSQLRFSRMRTGSISLP